MNKRKIISYILICCMILSGFTPHLAVSAANAKAADVTVIDAADYGADPSGETDSAEAIQRAIAAAKAVDGPVILNFPKGEYHIYPDKAVERELYISNTVGQDQTYRMKKIGFLLEDMQDVTLEGNGSLFMFHGKMTTYATIDCTNVTFQNFAFDFYVPTVVDVTVEAIDGNTATVYVPECYNYAIDGTSIEWRSDESPYTGQVYWTARNSMNYTQRYDVKTGITWRGSNPLFSSVSKIEDMGNHRLKFTYSSMNSDIQPGICFQMRTTVRDHAGMFFWKSKDVTLQDVDVYFLHGFGIVGQHSENITLRNVDFETPEGSGRTTAGYADFVQMSGCKGQILIEGCSFSNPHDDPINVHGTFNEVVERIADNKFKVRFMHNETAGFPNYFVGDEVEFIWKSTMGAVENSVAKVTAVEGPTGDAGADQSTSGSLTDMILTLDRAIPEGVTANTCVVENITYTPSVVIRNNIFKETPTRGILVTTRKPVLIENNIFDGMSMASIFIESNATSWYESGGIKDLTIRGNTFLRPSTSYAVIYIDPTGSASKTNPVHRNIRIEDNTFYVNNGPVLSAKSTSGISFAGNRVYRYEPKVTVNAAVSKATLQKGETASMSASATGATQSSALFSFNGCTGIKLGLKSEDEQDVVSNNLYDGGLNPRVNLSGSDPAVIGDGEDVLVGTDNVKAPTGAISYESDNEDVLTVNGAGRMTALKEGTARVRACTEVAGRKFASAWEEITVVDKIEASVSIEGGKDATNVHGEEIQYTASVTGEGTEGQSVHWSVLDAVTQSETACASIDENGLLTTATDGAVEVVARLDGGAEARKLLVINQGEKVLGKQLSVVREQPTRWALDENGEGLRLKSGAKGLWATQTADNIFLTAAPQGDVTAIVKMKGTMTTNAWDEAGLILYAGDSGTAGDDSFVFIGRKERGGGLTRIGVVWEKNVSSHAEEYADNIAGDTIWLKLTKSGTNVTGAFSSDGTDWTTPENFTFTGQDQLGDTLRVGFYCGNGPETAEFVFSDFSVNGEKIDLQSINHAPEISDVNCALENKVLSASWNGKFADADGDEEGTSLVRWASCDTEDGAYAIVAGLAGNGIELTSALAGKWVKALVVPQDSNGLYGAPVESNPVWVGDAVANLPVSVTIDDAASSVSAFDPITYHASVLPEGTSDTITWAVVDAATQGETACAAIDENGVLTPAANGVVEVSATTVNGLEARKLLVINRPNFTLGNGLEVLDMKGENAGKWKLTEDGKLQIKACPQGLFNQQGGADNIILYTPGTDLTNVTATVKLEGMGSGAYEQAGLMFYQDADSYAMAVRKIRGQENPVGWLAVEYQNSPGDTSKEPHMGYTDSAPVWLKLVKTGSSIAGYYSTDAKDENGWHKITDEAVTNEALGNGFKIGLIACGGNGGETPYTFSEFTVNGKAVELTAKNTAPSASNVTCSLQDNVLQAAWEFADETDTQGASLVRWMASAKEEGTYELVPGLTGNRINPPAALQNKWVKAVVVPQDSSGMYGEPAVASQPVQVGAGAISLMAESALAEAELTGVGSFGTFDSSKKAYIASASLEQNFVTARLKAKDENASLKVFVNGKEKAEGTDTLDSGNLELANGLNVILVKVTAEDGETGSDYRFAVIKTGDNNAELQEIKLDDQTLLDLESGKYEYDYRAQRGAETLKVAVQTASENASVSIAANGGKAVAAEEAELDLKAGWNDISIRVTPGTRFPVAKYSITVYVPQDNNANLKTMAFSDGVVLDQSFAADTTDYTGTVFVPYETMERLNVTLDLEAEETDAVIEVIADGRSLGKGTGSLFKEIPGGLTDSSLQVKVTSPDKAAEKVYKVHLACIAKQNASEMSFAPGSQNGWHPSGDNSRFCIDESIEGNPITLRMEDGSIRTFTKGIGAHATMTLIFDIEGKGYTNFMTYLGIDQEANTAASVRCTVYVDDVEVWNSGSDLMGKNTPATFLDIDVTGAKQIKIYADASGSNSNDHVSFGDPWFGRVLKEDTEDDMVRTYLQKLYDAWADRDLSIFTEESVQALESVLAATETILGDENASVEALSQATADLVTAIGGLQYRVQKLHLEVAIEAAEKLLASGQEFKDTKALTAAVKAGKAVLADQKATQEEADNAAYAILNELFKMAEAADLSLLKDLIESAKGLLDGPYTDSSLDDLRDAIKAAEEVVADEGRSEDDIHNAYLNLIDAIVGLQIRTNKAALEAMLKKANEILANAGAYVAKSIKGLEGVVKEAQAVYDDANASQKEIDEAVETLTLKIAQARLLGDVNNDGKVNTADSTEVLRSAAELATLSEEAADSADVNGDGKVDTSDAVRILQYAAEMITEF